MNFYKIISGKAQDSFTDRGSSQVQHLLQLRFVDELALGLSLNSKIRDLIWV